MNSSPKNDSKTNFWTTVPGILTGLAAIITATAGLMVALQKPSDDTVVPSVTTSSSSKPTRTPGVSISIITGAYELLHNDKRVGFESDWSRSQAVNNCAWNVERYGKQVVKCRFDGQSLGYELFHNDKRVGFVPDWSRSKAIDNCAWNVERYGKQVVRCRFDGQSLKI